MLDFLSKELLARNIELFGTVPLDKCQITRPYKLTSFGNTDPSNLSAVIIAVPYYARVGATNISRYAVPRDYHLFCDRLFGNLLPLLSQKFPQFKFCGFADNSPINERDAAALAGLGIIGDNYMLITEKYSSYVFLCEIITDCPIKHPSTCEIRYCEHCGRCRSACPMNETGVCLSALTQKKGELDEIERAAILKHGCAWGCDICQDVCPHTKHAIESGSIYSPIEFFGEELTPILSSKMIEDMSDEEFAHRAYSWRKKATIRRNLEILESGTQ